jgi:putative methyltransferase (TIGR04325 family)
MKAFIKSYMPPQLLRFLQQKLHPPAISFSGDFDSWQRALSHCTGYDDNVIIEKVLVSSLKVAKGEAVSERDSVILDHVQYSYPVLAWLLKIALMNQNSVRVLDFGGALGSTYRDFKHFMRGTRERLQIQWNIVEQLKFVSLGQKYFADQSLHFYENIESCLAECVIDVVILSSVVQYLESPHMFLEKLVTHKFLWVIFDRTAFIDGESDLLTVQRIRPPIYDGSYPAWFFTKNKFEAHFEKNYAQMASFDSFESWDLGNNIARDRGYVFKLITA